MDYRKKIGTKESPLELKTPPGSSSYTMHVDEKDGVEALVCIVGKTVLYYDIRCINDMHEMLKKHEDWMVMGSKDEKVETKPDTLEAWGRSANNPIGGWYGLRKGYRGRVGMYLPPLMEYLGLAEITHEKRGNKIKAK